MKAQEIMKILKQELKIYEELTREARKKDIDEKCKQGIAHDLYKSFDGGRVAIDIIISKIQKTKTQQNTKKTQLRKP